MSPNPFKAEAFQVGRITNAITTDVDGNLIFADVPNPQGVTLTQLLGTAVIISGGGGHASGKVYTINIDESSFAPTSYSFSGEATFLGFEKVVNHNLALQNKLAFTVMVAETATGRIVEPQEIIALNTNSIRLIMADTKNYTITITGF